MRNFTPVLFLILLGCFACQPKISTEDAKFSVDLYEQLPNDETGDIVRSVIEAVGGWNTWKNHKTLSFYKTMTYLDSLGNVERTLSQLHEYQLQPQFKARMTWKVGEDNHMVINNGEQAKKYLNGEELTDARSVNQAWNSSFGSHYVISMPYKLTDPGCIPSYEGLDTLTSGEVVHSLKVEYEKGAGSTGGMHDWWYYFSPEDFDLVGNFLIYDGKYSLTMYRTFEEKGDLRVHKMRHSFISNADRELVQLRTIYENVDLQFDVDLPDDHFEFR